MENLQVAALSGQDMLGNTWVKVDVHSDFFRSLKLEVIIDSCHDEWNAVELGGELCRLVVLKRVVGWFFDDSGDVGERKFQFLQIQRNIGK